MNECCACTQLSRVTKTENLLERSDLVCLVHSYLRNSGISDTPPPLQDGESPEGAEGDQDEADADAAGEEASDRFCA